MNKDSTCNENHTSLSYEAVSPSVLCPNSTDGSAGEASSSSNSKPVDTEEGNIEMPNDPTVPQTPTVE